MKIAFIVPSLLSMGPIRVVQDIIENLPLKVVDESVVFYLDDKKELSFKCRCEKISLFTKIDFDQFDVVHTHGLRPDLYAYIYRKHIRKHITTIHCYVKEDFSYQYNRMVSAIFSPIWLKLIDSADNKVVLSNHMNEYYTKKLNNGGITVIPNGRSISESEDIPHNDIELFENICLNNKKILGVVCAITKRKGIDQIIPLLSKNPNWHLIIIGEGKEKESLIKLKNLRNLENISFLGYRSSGHRYFKYFDVFLMLSRSEGFPLSLIEASAMGCPAVCSDLPQFTYEFTEDEVSFFILENKESLEKAIKHTLENRDKYSKRFRTKFLNNFTSKLMSQRYLNLYENVTSTH